MIRLYRIFFLALFLFAFVMQYCFAQNTYSINAINIYNSGVAYHKQHNYDMAEHRYFDALKIQPNFSEAKKNLSIIYYIKAQACQARNDNKNSIIYAEKAMFYGYKKIECYHLMANAYRASEDYDNAICIYTKILVIDPQDDTAMSSLAYLYTLNKQSEKAQDLYNKILTLNPSDKMARQNLQYVKYQQQDKKLTACLNNLKIENHAPPKIYRLIKRGDGVSVAYVDRMKKIMDLIWSESTGKKMLTTMYKKRIKIFIVSTSQKAETVQNYQTTYYSYATVPVSSYTYYKTVVNIPMNYFDNWENSSLSAIDRVYNLQVFIHEFGHAFMFANSPDNKDSIEEELGVSMLGYNIANKIITNEYLSEEQIKFYSLNCLQSLLSDDHKKLPFYGNFNNRIKYFGIELPYPENYSDLISMYKQLLFEKKIEPITVFMHTQ